MTVRRNSRWSRWLVLPIAAALVAAACGDDDDAGDTAVEDTSVEETSVVDTSAADTSIADTSVEDTSVEDTSVEDTTGDGAGSADGLTPVPDGLDLDASVNMAFSVAPNQLDPHRSATAGNNTYWYLWFDRLTEITNDLDVVPMLATEWSYSDDGTTFDMSLREDVVFHDGTPFNAEAVVANINRAKTIEGSVVANSLAGVESVEATGEYEVRFNLPEAQPANLPVLLSGNAGAMISPTFIANETVDLLEEIADVGSGPYQVVDWQPGQSVSYVRAPEFWDPGRQLLAELTISLVDPAARINGVRTGEFDVGQSAATDSAEAISIGESGGFSYHPEVINTVYGALFNPAMGDLANQQVRQAIMYAMDREAINEGLFEGRCEPRFQPFPEDSKYFFPEIEERYPYDPEMARQLVAESGIENPTFDVEVSPGSYEPFSQVMQAQLADVGITMNIVPAETSAAPVNFITGASESVYLVVLAQPDLASVYSNWYGGTFGNLLNPEVPEAAAIREVAAGANDASLTEEEQLEAWRGGVQRHPGAGGVRGRVRGAAGVDVQPVADRRRGDAVHLGGYRGALHPRQAGGLTRRGRATGEAVHPPAVAGDPDAAGRHVLRVRADRPRARRCRGHPRR